MRPQPAYDAIIADPEFKRLLSAKRRLRAGLSAIALLMFFGFVLLTSTPAGSAIASIRIGDIPLVMVLAVLIIAAVVILTSVYVFWSNRVLDPASVALREAFRP